MNGTSLKGYTTKAGSTVCTDSGSWLVSLSAWRVAAISADVEPAESVEALSLELCQESPEDCDASRG